MIEVIPVSLLLILWLIMKAILVGLFLRLGRETWSSIGGNHLKENYVKHKVVDLKRKVNWETIVDDKSIWKSIWENIWIINEKWISNYKGVELIEIWMKEFEESEIKMMKRTFWNFQCIGRWMSWIDCEEELNAIVDVLKLDLKELDEPVLEAGRDIWWIQVSFGSWTFCCTFDERWNIIYEWMENLFVWIEEVHFELRIWDVLNEWLRLVIGFYWWWTYNDHVEDAVWMSDGVNVIIWSECYDWRKFEFQDKIELNEWWRFEIGVMMVLIGKNLCEERI